MVTTYKSNLVLKKGRMRGLESGKAEFYEARFFFPDQTVLSTGDILLAVPLGENMAVQKVVTMELGDLGAATATQGYYQIKDNAGVAVVVQRNGPRGPSSANFTSPSDSASAYAGATALEGYLETSVAGNSLKLAGPANFALTIGTGVTVNGDTELLVGVLVAGETSQSILTGTQAPSGSQNDYLL